MNIFLARKAIVEIGKRMYERGMIAAHDGNISIRLSNGNIAITPAGLNKGFLKPEQMVIITKDGDKITRELEPTSEYKMHIEIYRQCNEVNAVTHAHPPYITAFSISSIMLPECVLPEVILTVGKIAFAPYATPSTDEVPKSISGLIKDSDAIILQNHGLVTWGKDVNDAFDRMDVIEHFAKIIVIAKGLGEIYMLNHEDISKLLKIKGIINGSKDSYLCKTCNFCKTRQESTKKED